LVVKWSQQKEKDLVTYQDIQEDLEAKDFEQFMVKELRTAMGITAEEIGEAAEEILDLREDL
jgi:hypothetical protein